MRRTGWARSAPVRGLREFVQMVGVKNVMRKELSVEVYGLDEFRRLDGPALIVANHASHLDTAVLLSTLPTRRRRHTAVAIEADYFFDSWWRASGSAIAFNTSIVPVIAHSSPFWPMTWSVSCPPQSVEWRMNPLPGSTGPPWWTALSGASPGSMSSCFSNSRNRRPARLWPMRRPWRRSAGGRACQHVRHWPRSPVSVDPSYGLFSFAA